MSRTPGSRNYVAMFIADPKTRTVALGRNHVAIAEAALDDCFSCAASNFFANRRSLGLPKVPTVESENIHGQQSVRGGVRRYRIAHAAAANQHNGIARTG